MKDFFNCKITFTGTNFQTKNSCTQDPDPPTSILIRILLARSESDTTGYCAGFYHLTMILCRFPPEYVGYSWVPGAGWLAGRGHPPQLERGEAHQTGGAKLDGDVCRFHGQWLQKFPCLVLLPDLVYYRYFLGQFYVFIVHDYQNASLFLII